MGEKVAQNASCPVERGRSEQAKVVRSRLIWVAYLTPGTMVTSKPVPWTMSDSVALLQP